MVDRLYVIVRNDLSAGQQAVQAMHSIVSFILRHPICALRWALGSNTLAFLAIPNEEALGALLKEAKGLRVASAGFREPDRDDELTAIAIGPAGRELVRKLRPALRASV